MELGFKGGLGFSKLPLEHTYYVEAGRFPELWGGSTDDFQSRFRRGFYGGAFVTVHLRGRFSLQPELLWAHKGGNVGGTARQWSGGMDRWELAETVEHDYLELPVLLKYRIPDLGPFRTSLFAGPYGAVRLGSRHSLEVSYGGDEPHYPGWTETSTATISNYRDGYDLGLVVGSELNLQVDGVRYVLDIRYTLGLRSGFSNADPKEFNYGHYESLFFEERHLSQVAIIDATTGDASNIKNRTFSVMLGVSFDL